MARPTDREEILAEIEATLGMVPNFFRMMGEADAGWLALNWERTKEIMLADTALDRKSKELIALAVSLVNRCNYCSMAHEAMAMMAGATEEEIVDLKKVVELFCSFNAIADSLKVPCDIVPPGAGGG